MKLAHKILFLTGSLVILQTQSVAALDTTSAELCFEENCYSVSLARTPSELRKGLMHVDTLPDGQGMLFIFEEKGYYSFWMKNTLIPLDIIWLDEDWRVIHIHHTAEPCVTSPCPTYSPDQEAVYVLEVNAGTAERTGLTEGQIAELK